MVQHPHLDRVNWLIYGNVISHILCRRPFDAKKKKGRKRGETQEKRKFRDVASAVSVIDVA